MSTKKKKLKALAYDIAKSANKKVDSATEKTTQKKGQESKSNEWALHGATAATVNAISKATPTGKTGGKLLSAAKTGTKTKTAADLYAETLAAAKVFGNSNEENKKALANSLAGNVITNPGKNGLNDWSDETARQAVIANVGLTKELAHLFNDEKYALNPQYSTLPELPYLKQLQSQKQMDLANSLLQDDYIKASKEQTAETEAQWRNLYKAVQEEEGFADEWYNLLLIDWLLGDREQLFDYEAADARYGVDVMDDATYEAELKRLREQRKNLDWETLTGSRSANYESQTALLQDQLGLLDKTIADKSKATELEELARSNPNFAALSQYTGPTLQMGVNDDYMFSDPLFYINNAGHEEFYSAVARDQLNWMNGQIEHQESPYWNRGYEFMDQEEKDILNVLRAMDLQNGTDNAAQYLAAIGADLASRRALGNESLWSTLASEDGTAWLAYALARGQGVMNYGDKLLQTVAAVTGKNDPNAYYYDEENMKKVVDSTIHGNIGDIDWLNQYMIGDQNIGQHVFNAGTGLIDSAIPLAVDAIFGGTGKINQALMAGQAYSQGLQESAERGLDPMQTLLNGGFDAFWGALVENVGVDPSVLTGKNKFLTNFLAEGAEGIVDNLGTAAKDDAISKLFGTRSQYEEEVSALRLAGDKDAEKTAVMNRMKDLLQRFVYEGLGGELMGIPGNIADYVGNRKTGKSVRQNGDADQVLQIALGMNEGTESNRIANEIQAHVDKGKAMTNYELGQLTGAIARDLNEEQASVINRVQDKAIEERLVELGDDTATAKANAPIIRKVYRGEKLTLAEKNAVAWNDHATKVVKELSRENNYTDGKPVPIKWVTGMKATQIDATGEVTGKMLKLQDAASTPNVGKAAQRAGEKAQKKVTGKRAKPTATYVSFHDAEGARVEGDILRIEGAEDGSINAVIQTGKGKDAAEQKVDIKNFDAADGEGVAVILEYVTDENAPHDLTAEEANTLLRTYQADGGNAQKYVEEFESNYRAGYAGIEQPRTVMNDQLARIAYENGKAEAVKDEEQRKTRASAYKALANPKTGWIGKVTSRGQVTGLGDETALQDALESMPETQRLAAEFLLKSSNAVGLNAVLYDSAGMGAANDIQNGMFDEKTHTVYYDVSAWVGSKKQLETMKKQGDLGAMVMWVGGHELTHYLEVAAPEAYAKYTEAVKAALKEKGVDFAVQMRERIDNANRQGRKLTMAGAAAEVIADASEYMLQDSKLVNSLDDSTKGKIKAFLQNFAEKVKDIFRQLTGGHKESTALREMKDGVYRYMEGLQELWDAGFDEIMAKGTADVDVSAAEAVEDIEPVQRFSMDRDVEVREDGLMAMHNLKESDVRGTLGLGGFPMPSIAIVKADQGHTMYGEYSVIFGRDTIDPQKDKKNRVYGADAWTPVFPTVDTEILDDEMHEREMEVYDLAGQVDEEFARRSRTFFANFSGSNETHKTLDDMSDSAWNNFGMLGAYMVDKGEQVNIAEMDVEVDRGYNPKRAETYNKILDMVGNDLVTMPVNELLDTYGDQLAQEIRVPFARLNANWKQGDRQAGVRMAEILRQAVKYEGAGRDTSVQTTKKKDYYATTDELHKTINREDFNNWVKAKLSSALGQQGIYNGKDRYTSSGKRRTFKQTHMPLTAENVVKSMSTQQESNIPVTDAKGLMAAAAARYGSVDEIRADAKRLGKISDEEYRAIIASADNDLRDFLNAIEAWDYDQQEEVGDLLVQAAKKKLTPAQISTLFKNHGYKKATLPAAKMAASLIDKVQNIPTGYFEAKPARVVGFDEIKMVVAPGSMPDDLAAAMYERGIPYTTYDGSDADRLEKANAVEGVRFSLRDVDHSEDTLQENMRLIQEMSPVVRLKGNEFRMGKTLKADVTNYYASIGGGVHNPLFGRISLNKRSVKDSLGHGMGPVKAIMYHAVPDVIANGKLIDYRDNWKNRGYDTAMVAAPVTIREGEYKGEYWVGAILNLYADQSQRFYVHEPIVVQKKSVPVVQTGTPEGATPGNEDSSFISILEKLNEVNPEPKFSERDMPEGISIREYLGAMKPTSSMNETEKLLLKRYQENLRTLEEKEKLVEEQEEIIRTAPFRNPDGSLNDEITKAKNRYKIYRDQANRAARALSNAEKDDGFARLMATSRQVVQEYLLGAAGNVADAQDALETEIRELTKQLTALEASVTRTASGQRAAFARGLYNPDDLKAAAQKLKDTYGSRMSVKTIADRLALAYGELYAGEGTEGGKLFMAASKDLATDLLQGNKFRYKSEILPMLREKIGTISLSDTDLQEIENAGITWTEYKRMLSPYIKVTAEGSDLSSYASNAEYYGDGALAAVLGDDTEGNLAMRLYDVISQERAKEADNGYEGMSESQLIGMAMADIAGANLPMSANSSTTEYLRKELLKYAGENTDVAIKVEESIEKAKKATAKAGRIWLEAAKNTETARQAVEYYRALDEKRRVMELAEQKKQITEQLKSDTAKKLQEKVEAQRQEYREREQKARAYRKQRDEVAKMRRRIGKKVKRLNTLRVRETDQKHVPQELKHYADKVMEIFTDSSLTSLVFHQTEVASLRRTYKILEELEEDWAYYWDDELEKTIDNLVKLSEQYRALKDKETEVSRYTLEGKELEMEILQGVENIVSSVMNMIDATNEDFLKSRKETFDQFATKAGETLRTRENHKVYKGVVGKLQSMLDESLRTGNVTPIYFFEHLDNQELLDVFNEVRNGVMEAAKIVAEGKRFIEETRARHNYGSWVADGKLTMQTRYGHTVILTREEAAEIYAIAKREEANKLYHTEHLLYGGFQYKHMEDKVSEDGKTLLTDKPHRLDPVDIAKIENWLTAEQKAYADDLVGYLSTTMADYGNEASMDMYGYNKFTEKYYIPFHTVADQRFLKGDEGPQGENAGTGRVKNSGFTKKLQYKANKPLYVGGITETVTDHIHKMAAYSAMVQPIENMKRLLNHQVLETDGTSNTIRALIGQKYGQASEDYLLQLLKDLNGATMSDNRASGLSDKLIGAFKRGAVMASASVTLQQPTAMVRAMAYISPKYFANNPFYRPGKGTWDEMMKYSGTAVIKDMGKFDVGMGLTATQYMQDEHLGVFETWQRLKGESKTKAGKEAYKRFMDWLTAAPGKADQWTWGLIWQAVKNEQAALHPGMDVRSEAFLELCGQRFDDVIDHTQVYDSVLTRSNLMRSTNALHKMATSFMSEPTLSLNMLYDAITGKHGKKQGARIIGSVVASQVLAGAMAALVQAWNDDDDERNWMEKYADRATGNILDNLNPLGMIPYMSDIVSLFEGYDVERPDMSVIADIYDYSKSFFKAFEDGGTPTWKQTENFAGTLANLVGVPAKNISREIRRLRNAVLNTDWSAPSGFGVGQAMLENTWFGAGTKKEYYQRIVTAKIRGDETLAEDYRTYMLASKAVDEDDLTKGIREAYKVQYEKGGIEKEDAISFLLENGLATGETEDKRKQSAFQYVDKWDEGTANYSAYNTLKAAYGAINYTDIQKAWKELTNNGYTDKQVGEQSRTLIKQLVQDGTLTVYQATQLLRKWYPYKKDSDNVDKPKEWLNSK